MKEFEDWYESVEQDLDCEIAENGLDRELDFDVQFFIEQRYEKYVNRIKMKTIKFNNVEVNLTKVNGNAYAIMAAVSEGLRKGGATKEEISQYQNESMSGDYDNLLRVAMSWVIVS